MVGSSTKIAVYITKALKALSNLGTTLSRNILTLWKIVRITTKIAKLSFKGFTLAGSQVDDFRNHLIICTDLQITWLRLLPFLPPVVVGLHVLFSAFWPQRILFYSTSQRRNFISGQLWHWVQVYSQLLSNILKISLASGSCHSSASPDHQHVSSGGVASHVQRDVASAQRPRQQEDRLADQSGRERRRHCLLRLLYHNLLHPGQVDQC